MKKRNSIFVAGLLSLALLASCKKDNNNQDLTGTDLMGANIEQPTSNGSRTHIEVSGNQGYVRWNEGDQFLVVDANGDDYTFTLNSGQSGETEPMFRSPGSDNMASPFAAVYPATNSIEGTTATISLPATQTYAEGTFANGTNVMVGYQSGSDREVDFKNVLGGLCFPLVGDNVTVTSLVLTSANADDHLSGTFTVDCTSNTPELTYVSDGGNSITIDCGNGVTLSNTPTEFYVMVPPETLTAGIIVQAFNNGNKVFEKSASAFGMGFITRNAIKKLNGCLEVMLPPEGAINGLFSVSSTQKVWFSQGNLQYQGSTNSWRFAEQQWAFVGDAAGNTTAIESRPAQVEWIDLFCWGTSGYDNTANDPLAVNYQPWAISTVFQSNGVNVYGYGPSIDMIDPNLVGTSAEYDWGVYHQGEIMDRNGGVTTAQWRSLTGDELSYVLNTRMVIVDNDQKASYGLAQVNGVNGLVILPDDWDGSMCPSFVYGTSEWSNIFNTTSSPTWADMENVGCVFLPASGSRRETTISGIGVAGSYWSSTHNGNGGASCLLIYNGTIYPNVYTGYGRCDGRSVRLVCNAN